MFLSKIIFAFVKSTLIFYFNPITNTNLQNCMFLSKIISAFVKTTLIFYCFNLQPMAGKGSLANQTAIMLSMWYCSAVVECHILSQFQTFSKHYRQHSTGNAVLLLCYAM